MARNPRNRDLASPGGLSEMKPPAGSLIAFATDAGHTAQDGDGVNGLYTAELLKYLRAPGLTIEQVFKRTRAGVMERSDGAQIPAEYSRLIGEDIYLAGPAPATAETAAVANPALKALPVTPPALATINKLAAAGKAAECVEALKLTAASRGAGDFAVTPLDILLDLAKEDLKELSTPAPKVEGAMRICELVLEAALEGAKLRLRPILMTSFAFILGCVPLMLAKGSGAASRSTMGTGVVFGMTISTIIGLFLIPVCYVFVQKFSDKKKKAEPEPAPAGPAPHH